MANLTDLHSQNELNIPCKNRTDNRFANLFFIFRFELLEKQVTETNKKYLERVLSLRLFVRSKDK